ncbi:MAG: 30S ribosomal protein S16 [Candidatus Nomurabacteria bacterium]|jgi:small subunit ribosomal protein S16|nr:30S ribosomal protein S16 [Candidatus Nomurabacteria bacterium]
MLAIRLQRGGRKGYPVYRVIVQESQRTPTSGRVVAQVGSYNPHTKEVNLKKDVILKHLACGAQPSPRVVKLLAENKIDLPKWVKQADGKKSGETRFPDKLRKNQPEEAPAEVKAEETAPVEAKAEEPAPEAEAAEPAETAPTEEVAAEEKPEEKADDRPAETENKAKVETAPEPEAEAEKTPEPAPETEEKSAA